MTLFQLEFLYAYIVVLGPSCKVPVVSNTHWLLIFESCVDYVDLVRPTIEDVKLHAFFNYFEIVRVNFLGGLLLEALQFNYDQILSSPMPQFPPDSTDSPVLPFIQSRNRRDNSERAIGCIYKIIDILEFGRRRWNQGHLKDRFEQSSAVMLARLRARNKEFHAYPSVGIPGTIPVSVTSYGQRSQGSVGLRDYLPEDPLGDSTNPRSRPGHSGFSSF